jgi:hypothetical protein
MNMEYLKDRSTNAAANTFTSIEDYAEFAAWVARGAGLNQELFNEVMTPQSNHDDPGEHFGIGWRLVRLQDRTILEHDGRENGVRTQVFVDPTAQSGLVILTNSSNGELIVRPLVSASISDGAALLRQRDADTWHYLQSLPGQAHWDMLNFIAGSPSFVQKLMYAAQVGLIEKADLDTVEQANSRSAIDRFVSRLHNQELSQPETMEQLKLLGSGEGKSFRLAKSLTADKARLWLRQLDELSKPVDEVK